MEQATGKNQGQAAQPQIQLRNIFPTPIAVMAVPGADAINKALEARILAREQDQQSLQHSNRGGWQSTHDLDQWGGPEAVQVLTIAQQLASQLTGERSGKPATIKWRLNAWANINRHGQANEFHTHPGAFWSATYYVSDGGAGQSPDIGGEFEMQDPRGVGPAMLAPQLCFRTQGGQSMGASEMLVPRAGALVMFPSWLSHAVRPYHGDGVRISIALNLTPS
ncbi:MAG: TIGR02466 family protein [Pseudomonadota bacterium]